MISIAFVKILVNLSGRKKAAPWGRHVQSLVQFET